MLTFFFFFFFFFEKVMLENFEHQPKFFFCSAVICNIQIPQWQMFISGHSSTATRFRNITVIATSPVGGTDISVLRPVG